MSWQDDSAELKKRRQWLGISQRRLAQLAGVKASWIAAVETGRVPMRGPKLLAMFKALAVVEQELKRENPGWILQDGFSAHGPKEYKASKSSDPHAENLAILHRLIATQDRLIELQRQGISKLMQEGGHKDEKITRLEKQVADLRALYDAGTDAALANARFEELREKVSIKEED
jgi:transcriptional regulator with XRE-family HTH domain